MKWDDMYFLVCAVNMKYCNIQPALFIHGKVLGKFLL